MKLGIVRLESAVVEHDAASWLFAHAVGLEAALLGYLVLDVAT